MDSQKLLWENFLVPIWSNHTVVPAFPLATLLKAQGWDAEGRKKDSELNLHNKQKMVEAFGFWAATSKSYVVYNSNC